MRPGLGGPDMIQGPSGPDMKFENLFLPRIICCSQRPLRLHHDYCVGLCLAALKPRIVIKRTSLLRYNLEIVRSFSSLIAIILLASWTTATVCPWICPQLEPPAAQESACHSSEVPDGDAGDVCDDCPIDIQLAPLPEFSSDLLHIAFETQSFSGPVALQSEGRFPLSPLPSATLDRPFLTTVIRV